MLVISFPEPDATTNAGYNAQSRPQDGVHDITWSDLFIQDHTFICFINKTVNCRVLFTHFKGVVANILFYFCYIVVTDGRQIRALSVTMVHSGVVILILIEQPPSVRGQRLRFVCAAVIFAINCISLTIAIFQRRRLAAIRIAILLIRLN